MNKQKSARPAPPIKLRENYQSLNGLRAYSAIGIAHWLDILVLYNVPFLRLFNRQQEESLTCFDYSNSFPFYWEVLFL